MTRDGCGSLLDDLTDADEEEEFVPNRMRQLAAGLYTWRLAAAEAKAQAFMAGGAIRRMMNRKLSMAWEKWQYESEQMKLQKMLLRRGIMGVIAAQLARAMSTWREFVAAGLPSVESVTNSTSSDQGDESDMVARLKEVIEGLQGQLAAADESVLSAQQRKAQVDNEKAELEEQLMDSQDSFAALSELLESAEEVNMVMERQCHHLQNQVNTRPASGSADEAAQLRIEVAEAAAEQAAAADAAQKEAAA